MIYGGPLTEERLRREFPLQNPGGSTHVIEQQLRNGNQADAELRYVNLRAIDQGRTELIADELLDSHGFSPFDLNVLRALRVGIRAGLQEGRQEGAEILDRILQGEE